MTVPVLIVDADPVQRRIPASHLEAGSGSRFRVHACGSVDEARKAVGGGSDHVVLADVDSLGGPARVGLLAENGTPVIAMSAGGSVATAVAAMQAGATDFTAKPVGARRLIERLEAAAAALGHSRAVATEANQPSRSDFPGSLGPARVGLLAENGTPVIAMSAGGSVATAVAAMQAGATDFTAKPVGARRLIERLEAAAAALGHSRAVATEANQPSRSDFPGFVGPSREIQDILDQIEQIAARAPVFLTGESGTGKDLCAQMIHARGGDERPYVAINCGAIPADLAESELFGHVRGAFTGAVGDRSGVVELADGGTLLLDEIGEMPVSLQAKLLRVVQTGEFQRVGDRRTRSIDVRFIAATNRDPHSDIVAGRFREDLFYRLNVLPIRLPALRDRPDDIIPLASHFLAHYASEEGRDPASFRSDSETFLLAQPWPGNVRRLQNLTRRIAILSGGETVSAEFVRAALAEFGVPSSAEPSRPMKVVPFRDQERGIIESALVAHSGNIVRAAAALEINPSTIYRKRQTWMTAG